jgi:hypothetical protein
MRNVSDRQCRENQNTFHIQELFFFKSYFYEITWKNIVEPDRPQMTIWRMRISCWITKATNTHSEYVMLLSFPQQQWLHKGASILRCTYIDCFFFYILMTVLLDIILINNQIDAQFPLYIFISILYMFRATMCSSSGESIVSKQRLVYVTVCRWTSGMQVGTGPAYLSITNIYYTTTTCFFGYKTIVSLVINVFEKSTRF